MIVELFAGPGGWDEGARLLGIHGIVGYEHDDAACVTAETAGHLRIHEDVTRINYGSAFHGPVNGLIASPPCQSYSRAGKGFGLLDQPAVLAHVDLVREMGEWTGYPSDGDNWHDPRSPLVLEVLRAVFALCPTWIALEQVPDVLPLWVAFGAVLETLGYRVWTGILDAEMYGVPQTRDRAMLTASLDAGHNVTRPPATHRRWVKGVPDHADLFNDLLPPVSMAQALGWGMTGRPGMTVTAGGTETGGAEPFGHGARDAAQRNGGGWTPRVQARSGAGDD